MCSVVVWWHVVCGGVWYHWCVVVWSCGMWCMVVWWCGGVVACGMWWCLVSPVWCSHRSIGSRPDGGGKGGWDEPSLIKLRTLAAFPPLQIACVDFQNCLRTLISMKLAISLQIHRVTIKDKDWYCYCPVPRTLAAFLPSANCILWTFEIGCRFRFQWNMQLHSLIKPHDASSIFQPFPLKMQLHCKDKHDSLSERQCQSNLDKAERTGKSHLVHCCTLSLCYLGAETDDQRRWSTQMINTDD